MLVTGTAGVALVLGEEGVIEEIATELDLGLAWWVIFWDRERGEALWLLNLKAWR